MGAECGIMEDNMDTGASSRYTIFETYSNDELEYQIFSSDKQEEPDVWICYHYLDAPLTYDVKLFLYALYFTDPKNIDNNQLDALRSIIVRIINGHSVRYVGRHIGGLKSSPNGIPELKFLEEHYNFDNEYMNAKDHTYRHGN